MGQRLDRHFLEMAIRRFRLVLYFNRISRQNEFRALLTFDIKQKLIKRLTIRGKEKAELGTKVVAKIKI